MAKKDTHNIPKGYEKSVEKSQVEVESKEANIIVDGKKNKSQARTSFRINRRVILIVLVTGFAVLSIAGALYWFNTKKSDKDTADGISEVVTPDDVYNTTGSIIKESLNTEDPAQKLANYEDLASIALAANKLDEALDYAQKAEELGKGHTHAYVLGRIYEKKGDTQKAIEYYELAMSRATPPTFEGENTPYTDYRLAKEALVN